MVGEEEDIPETGEFIFLWPIFEEIYTEMTLEKFGDVRIKLESHSNPKLAHQNQF